MNVRLALDEPPSYVRNGKRIQLQGPPAPWDYFIAELDGVKCFRACPLRAVSDLLAHTTGSAPGPCPSFVVDEREIEDMQAFREWRDGNELD